MVAFILNKDRAWLYANQDHQLHDHQLQQLDDWFNLLADDMPVAYITGQQAFWNLSLKVNHATLIPRPDTELLIEVALNSLKNPHNILDLGTGSGAIALALAKEFPEAQVVGVDISAEALEIAAYNAKNNHISNVNFLQSDWFSALATQAFDLIVSNPPYIADSDPHLAALKHEPSSALIAADNGLSDFKAISTSAKAFLRKGGVLLFEHGWQQKNDVQSILKNCDYQNIKTYKDLAGQDRATLGFS